jgi:hypothetical protein
MHSINISLRFYSLSDKYKNIDKIIFIKDIVIILLILLQKVEFELGRDANKPYTRSLKERRKHMN